MDEMDKLSAAAESGSEKSILIETVTAAEYTRIEVDNPDGHFSIHQPPSRLYTISYKRDRNYAGGDPHIHLGFFEILFFLEGNVQYYISGERCWLQPGDVLLISPGTLHKGDVDTSVPYERIVLHVSQAMLRMLSTPESDLGALLQKKADHAFHPGVDIFEETVRILGRILVMEKVSAVAQDILIRTKVTEVLVRLLQAIDVSKESLMADAGSDLMRKIMIYIDAHLTENLSLSRIAEDLNISRSLLSHEFKKNYGNSLWNYVIMRRLSLSQELLAKGASVTSACYDAGFQNYSNYIKTFTKTFGITPRQYASSRRSGTVYL